MFRSDRSRPLDYERAVVVDEEFAEYESKPLSESGRISLFKKEFDRADIVRDVRFGDYTGVRRPDFTR